MVYAASPAIFEAYFKAIRVAVRCTVLLMPHLCPVISKNMVSPLRRPVALIGWVLRVNEKVNVSPTILPFSISDGSP